MNRKSTAACALSGALLLLLTGCAKDVPETPENPLPSAAAAETNTDFSSAIETVSFDTKDGVRIHWMIDPSGAGGWDIPVLNIAPHTITVEEAHRAADAIFGDAAYYEHRGIDARPMTKSVLTEKLALWESLLEPGALEAIYGDQPEEIAQKRETIETFIENARAAYASAPETEERVISDWGFHPWEYYAAMTDFTPDGNVSIEVDTVCSSTLYTFFAANRDRGDFYLNVLSAYPYTGYADPDLVEDNIFRIGHSYDAPPTDAQLESAQNRAAELLGAFGLGEWKIDSCAADERAIDPDAPRYTIQIKAVPVLNGIEVMPQRPLLGMNDAGAGDIGWYYSEASFEFGPDNTLLFLRLESPADIQSTEDHKTLSGAEASAALQKALAEKDLSAFFVSAGARKHDVYIYELRPYYRRTVSTSGQYQYIPCLAAMAAFDGRSISGQPLESADWLYPLLTIDLLA